VAKANVSGNDKFCRLHRNFSGHVVDLDASLLVALLTRGGENTF